MCLALPLNTLPSTCKMLSICDSAGLNSKNGDMNDNVIVCTHYAHARLKLQWKL